MFAALSVSGASAAAATDAITAASALPTDLAPAVASVGGGGSFGDGVALSTFLTGRSDTYVNNVGMNTVTILLTAACSPSPFFSLEGVRFSA